MKGQLDEIEVAAQTADMAAFFHAGLLFHRLLWKASGNPCAAKALESSMGSLFASGLARSERGRKAGTAIAIDRGWKKWRSTGAWCGRSRPGTGNWRPWPCWKSRLGLNGIFNANRRARKNIIYYPVCGTIHDESHSSRPAVSSLLDSLS